ncbi:thioredoxin domain-containing protein [Carboxylicivirga sp. M1479]|uniref:thioredoxin family protein n=1 Tax=Carboxylicivirga sp. M1479 TaxID=2594476 RepID=UPI00117766A4|nr:thioredoxin domain-containing protein [Carboxylicivirga sp. M1479]TRX71837.1 DUF255 domain-containing protein [Carboxylicivirga sp. M1479]
MKTLLSILLSLIVITSWAQDKHGIQFTHGSWSEVKQLAKEQNKAIFIDCYTEWCGPCKMLSKDIFTQDKVGQLFNNNFINYKVDMEKGEGPKLKEQFNVAAFPTLVWVDGDGNELHKSVGAPKAEALINIAQLVIDGKGMVALQRQYEATPDDYQTMLTYIETLSNAYEKQKIQIVLADYFTNQKGKKLLSETNYLLINNYLNDIYSPAFTWFDKHQNRFKDSYTPGDVDQKLYQTYLSYGQSLIKKNKVDYPGFEKYKQTLKTRKVVGKEKMLAYVQESIYRSEKNWDAYIKQVNRNMELGYHDSGNSFLYYNWARSISGDEDSKKSHHLQAAQWMEKAFEVSQWPLANNIVYLDEKLKILINTDADTENIEKLKKRIARLNEEIKKK